MSEDVIKILLTGGFMVLVAVVTGVFAWRNKKVAEPTPIETLWSRIDRLEEKAETQGRTISTQGTTIDGLNREVRTLKESVVAYRGGFLAFVSRDERMQATQTGPIIIVPFTPAEQAAIRRGLDMVELERLSADEVTQ